MYKIYALIGKSASGKDTIVNELLKKSDKFHGVVSHTTRPKRDYEIDKKDYYFVTEEDISKLCEEDKILELSCFNSWLYGTCIDSFDKEKINIGVFNIQGINSLCEREDVDLRVFYVQTKDKLRLIRQLSREENPNIQEILRRYETDEQDFKEYNIDFPYVAIENNNTEDFHLCLDTIIAFSEEDFLE